MLLTNVTSLGKSVNLADKQAHEDSNVVTILMGNNSSGKSRIFQTICSAFIRTSHNDMNAYNLKNIINLSDIELFDSLSYTQDGDLNSFYRVNFPIFQKYDLSNGAFITLTSVYPYEQAIRNHVHNVDDESLIESITSMFLQEVKNYSSRFQFKKNGEICNSLKIPNKVLAVTGSPYDKFPFARSYSGVHNLSPYVYLGAREKERAGYRRNQGYLSYKFDQLGASFIKLLLKPKQEYFDFSKVLNFLKISSSFTLKLYFSDRVGASDLTQEKILDLVRSIIFFKGKDHEAIINEIDKDELSKRLLEAVRYIGGEELEKNVHQHNPIEILCQIDLTKGVNDKLRLNSLELLSEYGLIELEDVIFSKLESKQDFLLSQASSGELSLLFTMSSIAGEIQNGSLILIDEPEISLHPKWQLNFLSLLTDVFSSYKSCHFIIATHSPNIISSLPNDDAYIVNLETNEAKLMHSEMYHNRSVDFQLARVFDSPGNNNEYLLSQVIEVLDKLCKSEELDSESFHRAKWLLTFENKVGDDDKVKILLKILKQTMEALKIK
ncbi:AAA family ATPase [Serratia fonticola]|uniref:AAA family ATPase n=1 Tax=Serratia fonticola TaxID=47917 RepID=A0AAJ2DC20_SERFO|nr:AAA family ATPase [Serratia fonticola]MDQ9130088.1 AAA family ATPase [Serratia fonticola]